MDEKIYWHNISWRETVKLLYSNIHTGLNEQEVEARQIKFGKNSLPTEKQLSKTILFLRQFKSPLIYILVVAGIITFFLNEFADTIVIFGAVFVNVIVGFVQENKASETLKKLKTIVKYDAEVLRDGNFKIIDSLELVPGDIVLLNPGDKVPADGRLIEAHGLKINEMSLTGEWIAADKSPEIKAKETPMADRDNMIYMSAVVEEGKGKAIVTDTGEATEIGKVAQMIKDVKEKQTPYQQKLSHFSKIIGGIIGLISIIIFIEGVLTGEDAIEMFVTSVAVAVAAIPEGLPVAMTVILAIGMQKILKKQGLVRKLASAETLGSTSIIATDKTRTLTEGIMTVSEVIASSKKDSLKTAVLCIESFIENNEEDKEKWVLRGRPTEKAILLAAIEAGLTRKEIEKHEKRVGEISFNPIQKYSAALYKVSERKHILYVLGAPEKILNFCKLRKKEKEVLENKLEELAKKGLRIVATAHKDIHLSTIIKEENNEVSKIKNFLGDLVFTGFITLKDPIRKEAAGTIKICRQAGLKFIMVTGDHKLTAQSVAEELGLKIKKENIMEGKDLDAISDEDFKKVFEKVQIYARVEPKHKLRIIEAWQNKGEIVAMTGDGVNDAPALKRADIGVALGSGTAVAKDSSDLVLLNDNFSIIISAIEEGRVIIDNIRKVITYLLSDSFTEVILISFSLLFGYPLPVAAVQILWVNLIEDGLPSTALAFENREENIMKRKPQHHRAPLLTKEMKAIIFAIGILTDFFLLGLFIWLTKFSIYKIEHIRTIIFSGLAINSLFYVFSCKNLRKNLWNIKILSNKFLLFAWAVGVVMLVGAIYFQPLQILLKTVPLNLFDWQLVLGIGAINLILIEATKWYFIARHQTEN